MKTKRHVKILELIREEAIQTQAEMAEKLQERGIEATQATVSRDIKRLGLIKIPTGDGNYRYSLPPEKEKRDLVGRMERMFRDSVLKMESIENQIVIRTLPGTAQGIASLIDHSEWSHILGTVAGDDTILVIVKPKSRTPGVLKKLRQLCR